MHYGFVPGGRASSKMFTCSMPRALRIVAVAARSLGRDHLDLALRIDTHRRADRGHDVAKHLKLLRQRGLDRRPEAHFTRAHQWMGRRAILGQVR
jgi:hypothetical protein